MSDDDNPSATRPDEDEALARLEEAIGYHFGDRTLLVRAMTHPSYVNEHEGVERSNQRLEFLGDAVLGLATATELFERDDLGSEGLLSAVQAEIVCEPALARIAEAIVLGDHMRLGHGEEVQGGRTKDSLLSDTYEALLAAVYLDGGFEAAHSVVARLQGHELDRPRRISTHNDPKSLLQKRVQSELSMQPRYHTVREHGPAHARCFEAEVRIGDEVWGRGEGPSKKEAEREAALEGLEHFAAISEDRPT